MQAYIPDPEFVRVVRSEIVSSLPFPARMAVKVIPVTRKDQVVALALAQVIPLAFSAVALSGRSGGRIALTKDGDLTKEVKGGFLKRIAYWFVPSELVEIALALHREVVRVGNERLSCEAWSLEVAEGDVVLLVLDTSRIKETADTVADLFVDSFETLKAFKTKIFSRLKGKSSEATA